MSNVANRFIKYAKIDTTSDEHANGSPSSENQFNLARILAQELAEMGACEIVLDNEYCYVYATIPATCGKDIPALGFIAHMDTSPAVSGKCVQPQIIRHYNGAAIELKETHRLSPDAYPDLKEYIGMDIITADGTTLLGADDKAGIAEIMEMAQHLLSHPELEHGVVKLCFTPDEEIGRGVNHINLDVFDVNFAYTVDGGRLGEFSYENFNAACAGVILNGVSTHPGDAKDVMVNALHIAMELHSMLPAGEDPASTQGYEGFYHLVSLTGDCEQATMTYMIRDHDRIFFDHRKKTFETICRKLQEKYGDQSVDLLLSDSYNNMHGVIEHHRHLIDHAVSAMHDLGITPFINPIRGGTDGARLSFMGIPCPNLGTGGHNFHSRYEYIPIQSMERVVELLVRIVTTYADKGI